MRSEKHQTCDIFRCSANVQGEADGAHGFLWRHKGKKLNGWVEGKTDVSVVRSQLDQFSAVWPGHINKNANTLRAPKIQFGSGRAKGNPYWGVAPAGRDHSVSN